MCGIAGIIGVGPDAARRRSEDLSRMSKAVAHRGPDGEGRWFSDDGRVGLAHRRLTIIDFSATANQPMVEADGRAAVTFNGEIYNHRELRRELEANGCRFSTDHSDTEVLLHGYLSWGMEGLLDRLSGIFAFCLYDIVHGTAWLARDHAGIKPLYVTWVGDDLFFASELRSVLAASGVKREPDYTALQHYLTFMAVPAPCTGVAGVYKIPAGHAVRIDAAGGAELFRYWSPFSASQRDPREITPAHIRDTIVSCVERQMVSDTPVGVLLSGGLDSTTLLAVGSRALGRPLDSFSIGFRDAPELDEIADASATAAEFGSSHHVVTLGDADAVDAVEATLQAMDEPNADWVCVPLCRLAAEVRRCEHKVILVGEGADEQFAGYQHFLYYLSRVFPIFALVAHLPSPLTRLMRRTLAWASGDQVRALVRGDFLRRAAAGGEPFWSGAVQFWPDVQNSIAPMAASASGAAQQPRWTLRQGALRGLHDAQSQDALVADWLRYIAQEAGGTLDPLNRMIALEFVHRLPELLLMRVDNMTMAHGIEARVPLLDRALLTLSFSIPGKLKAAGAGTKALMREALAGIVPDRVRLASKRGFGAPVGRWLHGELGSIVLDTIYRGPLIERGLVSVDWIRRLEREHRSGSSDHAGYLWSIFILTRWWRRTIDGTAA
jgi:asparagine synthase (glutamine-hydrolysing)